MTATLKQEAPGFPGNPAAPFIDTPGVYDDLPEGVYHGDPVPEGSLSVSSATMLLPPSCPARFRWEQDHPVHKRQFDYGSGAHKYVLGTGPEIVVIDAANYQTNKAKTERDEARAAGKIPLLEHEHAEVQAMAAAIRRHPLASRLFDPQLGGKAEQSLFWRDAEYGIWRRGRLDWMPDPRSFRRFAVVDYKSCVSADEASLARAVANYGYYMQADWYCDGITALGLHDSPEFLFVCQEKTEPYLINVVRLADRDVRAGRARNREAIERYRDCRAADLWPGYSLDSEITTISMPSWARNRDFGSY